MTRPLRPLLAILLAAAVSGPAAAQAGSSVEDLIAAAIAEGVPLYNGGDHAGCARVYEDAARRLLALGDEALSPLDRGDVESALASSAESADSRAWSLRDAFDRVLANARYEPYVEAPLPEGFPGPGPLGRVVVKDYPRYRAARAAGADSFGTLFRHITNNDVKMTAPVEMTVDDRLRPVDMAFLYEGPGQGTAGRQGNVRVLDLEPTTVLSIGMRGARSAQAVRRARAWIEEAVERDGWSPDGPWRLLGYNSPMVPPAQRFWELQVPVTRRP